MLNTFSLDEDEETAEEGAESAEDISNLQRAWEMFELAKLVYSKNFNEDLSFKNKRVAECLLKLGEIGIEQELYEQASNDIKESIRLQEEQKDEDRDERMLAESYYQQALAQQFNNQFDDAKESFQRALNILQLRIEKLRGRLETQQIDEDEKNKLREEIADIEELLPDLNGKLEEVN
jgi:tetratricopeptide (TPR) repeat protein